MVSTIEQIQADIVRLANQSIPFQNLSQKEKPPIENLVFEGGGVKGLVYAGALQVLEERGVLDTVKRVAGSSAGGIVSLLVAVGYTPTEIEKIMSDEIDFTQLMDRRVNFDPTRILEASGMKIGLSDMIMLFQHKGMYQGEAFVALEKKLISQKLEETMRSSIEAKHQKEINDLKKNFSDLKTFEEEKEKYLKIKFQSFLDDNRIDNLGEITFGKLNELRVKYPELNIKELYITGTKLSDMSLKIFGADTDPQMRIADAVRITMSFPFGFEPVLYQGDYYADGGIADNYPMQIFDREHFLTHGINDAGVNPCTLGFLVDSQQEIESRWGAQKKAYKDKIGLFELAGSVIAGMHNRTEILKDLYSVNSIQIYDEDVPTMDMALNANTKKKLIHSGRNATAFYADNYISSQLNLPDFDSIEQFYRAKSPQALAYTIEEELGPLSIELANIISTLKNDYLENEEIQAHVAWLRRELEVNKDYQEMARCFDEMKKIADHCNDLEVHLLKSEREIVVLTREISDSSNPQLHHAKLATLIEKKREIMTKLDEYQENFEEISRQIETKKDLYDQVEQYKIYTEIDEMLYLDILQKIDMVVNEHLDTAVAAMEAYREGYLDPRVLQENELQIQQVFTKIYESLLKKNQRLYQQDVAIEQTKQQYDLVHVMSEFYVPLKDIVNKIDEHQLLINFIKSKKIIELGVETLTDEQEQQCVLDATSRYFSTLSLSMVYPDGRDEEMLSYKRQFDQFFIDKYRENGSLAEALHFSHHQLNKKYLYAQQQPSSKQLDSVSDEFHYSYVSELKKINNQLAKGSWGNDITLSDAFDISHNLMHMETLTNKETIGKYSSNYSIKTIEHKIKHHKTFMSKNRPHEPSIKAHILTPEKEILKNDKKQTKEIIVSFDTEQKRGHRFYEASKYSEKREKSFNETKGELLKQIRWALREAKAQNVAPKDAVFNITIYGEGLAGQDAQYMFKALIEDIKTQGELNDYKYLNGIDLLLSDTSRVSKNDAIKTEQMLADVQENKRKNNMPLLNVKGYNVIHKHRFGRAPSVRRRLNHIGEENILSRLNKEDAHVELEYRDYKNPTLKLSKIDNSSHPQEISKELNKKLWLNSSRFIRTVMLRGQNITHFGINLINRDLPLLYRLLIKVPFTIGKRIVKNSVSPFVLLHTYVKERKNKKKKEKKQVNWSQRLQQSVDDRAIEAEHKNEVDDHEIQRFVEATTMESRLDKGVRPPIENVVLEGGGVKGLVYAGALKEMEDKGLLKDLKRVAGSSAGGITATLLAIGFTADELKQAMVDEIDFSKLMDKSFSLGGIDTIAEVSGMQVSLTSLFTLAKHKGLYKGDAFKSLMTSLYRQKLTENIKEILLKELDPLERERMNQQLSGMNESSRNQFLDKYLDYLLELELRKMGVEDLGTITFGQLHSLGKRFPQLGIKELYITGTKISDGSLRVFSAQADSDMPVIDAVRVTMSFPGGFMPVYMDGDYYADGGIANNYPMEIFDGAPFLTHGLNDSKVNPCTVGLLVDSKSEIEARWGVRSSEVQDMSLFDFIGKVIGGMHNRSEILRDKYNINSIQIDDNVAPEGRPYQGAETMALDLSQAEKMRLVNNGHEAIANFHQLYVADENASHVIYHQHPSFQNYTHKYFSMHETQLFDILNNEVNPLLAKYKKIKIKLVEEQKSLENEMEILSNSITDFENMRFMITSIDNISFEIKNTKKTLTRQQGKLDTSERLQRKLFDLECKKDKLLNEVDKWSPELQQKINRYHKAEKRMELIAQAGHAGKNLKQERKVLLDALKMKGVLINSKPEKRSSSVTLSPYHNLNKELESLLNHLKDLQPILEMSMLKNSEFINWLDQSEHDEPVKNLNRELGNILRNKSSVEKQNTLMIDLFEAIKNLDKKPTLLKDVLQKNPELREFYKKNVRVLRSVNEEFQSANAERKPHPSD